MADTLAAPDSGDLLLVPAGVSRRDLTTARWCARAGLVAVVVSMVLIVLLHLVPPSSGRNPISRTISEYELLSNGWVFDLGVSLLAVGSAALLLGLMRIGLVRALSWTTAMLGLWCVGLIGLIVFPKQGFGPDPSVAGRVHWTWTLIAFFSLPIGATLACLRRDRAHRWPRRVLWCCLFATFWFLVLTVQTVLGAVTTWHIWNMVGLVERAVSLGEIAAVGCLGMWLLGLTRSALGDAPPPTDQPEVPVRQNRHPGGASGF